MQIAATNTRNFRTFLLVSQLEARQIGERLQLARKRAGMTHVADFYVEATGKDATVSYAATCDDERCVWRPG